MRERFPSRFARESAGEVADEIRSLMLAHWVEVGHYRDLKPDPDIERFHQLEAAGVLRIYTARGEHVARSPLCGYAIYLLSTDLLFRQLITAQAVALYLHPDYRRGATGAQFIRWSEAQMQAEGACMFLQSLKAQRGRATVFTRLLERQGYELHDLVLSRKVR